MGEIVDLSSRFVAPSVRKVQRALPKFERGLILSCPYQIDVDANFFGGQAHFDPYELRRAALFWDRLVIPDPCLPFPLGLTPEVAFLHECGVLDFPKFPANGEIASGVLSAYAACFRTLEGNEPGRWAMSPSKFDWEFKSIPNEGRGAEVRPIQSVPLPRGDAPLEDVLNFKAKRGDELNRFRLAVDRFFDKWLTSEDRARALASSCLEIEQSCNDLVAISKEVNFPTVPFQFLISFGLTAMGAYSLNHLLQEGSLGQQINDSLVIATTIGAGGMGLLSLTQQRAPKLEAAHNAPYKYVASIHRHLPHF